MSDWQENTLVRQRVVQDVRRGTPALSVAPRKPEPSLFDCLVWRDALATWLGLIALIFVTIYVGRVLILAQGSESLTWGKLFANWLGWDGSNYATIARSGYSQLWMAGLSPMLPALEFAVSAVTGLPTQVAGGIIAPIAALVSFGLLRVLVEREFGREVARSTVFYLAIFPTAFILLTAYTESLSLAFTIGAILAMRRERWLIAGALIALAVLTHLTGIALLPVMFIEIARRWRKYGLPSWPTAWLEWARVGVALALAPLAWGAFDLYLYHQFGTFSAPSQAQKSSTGKGISIPLIGFARAGGALIRNGFNPGPEQAHIVLDGAFTLALVVMTIVVWRRLPLVYGLYTALVTLIVVSTPEHNWYALESNPRFVLDAFPVFIVLGMWGERPWVSRLMLCASLPLLALFTLIFVMGYWIV